MPTVLLAAAVWTLASLVVAAACCVLARGARLSAAREAEHLARVRPAVAQPGVEDLVPAPALPAGFAQRRAADDMVRLP